MSRRNAGFGGETINPELVGVSCQRCGDLFTTDETTARAADQGEAELLCADCEAGGQPAPSQMDLEQPNDDEVRDDLGREVGPDAEPEVEATISEEVGFGELHKQTAAIVKFTRGTQREGTITVWPGEVDGQYLPIDVDPSVDLLSDEATEAVVSELSSRTQLLIEVQ